MRVCVCVWLCECVLVYQCRKLGHFTFYPGAHKLEFYPSHTLRLHRPTNPMMMMMVGADATVAAAATTTAAVSLGDSRRILDLAPSHLSHKILNFFQFIN